MGYLGKSINMALLALLIGIVVVLISITVFFQFGLKDRTSAYESTSENLTACEDELARYQGDLTSAQSQIDSTAQDIRRYDQLYESKVAELVDTEDELKDTQGQVATLKLIKTGLEAEKANLQQQKRELDQQINQLNDRIDDLRDDVDYYENKYDCCRADPINCNSC